MSDNTERQNVATVKPNKLSRAVSACHDFTTALLILSLAAWEEGCGENGLPRWEIYMMKKAGKWLRKRPVVKSLRRKIGSLRRAL